MADQARNAAAATPVYLLAMADYELDESAQKPHFLYDGILRVFASTHRVMILQGIPCGTRF